MAYTIDIDTGGTFTDGYIIGDGHIERVKTPSTPHDFTVCFMNCIDEAAERFNFADTQAFLNEVKHQILILDLAN